ncbi:MAG: NADH-quinone oxidoreductase subunit D [Planctomycetota bacterium]|nr:MAG: NADH-quinone oxidoreductase subunit D [Planctomycetota bacterium]
MPEIDELRRKVGLHAAELLELPDEEGVSARHMVMNFGPQHPATHGTLRLILELDGERIVRCVPECGYLHTGFEKLGEYRTWNQFVPLSDRTQYLSAMNNNIAYCIAVEDLLGLEVPPRGRAVRIIMAELGRIADHILCVGLQGMDLGAFTAMLWSFIERERAYDIFDVCSGGRLTVSYGRVGGVAFDVPIDFEARVKVFIEKVEETVADIEGLLSRNRIWCDRTVGIGVLSREDALACGCTGPVLRASGVPYDVRRVRPYLGYEELDFEVPTFTDGDVYARYLQRLAEIKESIKIIRQLIDNLPPGPVNALGKHVLPGKDLTYSSMEELIHHFELVMPGYGVRPPAGETYCANEVPTGEQGYYLISDGSGIPYRVRIRPPSFYHFAALPKMLQGAMIADVVAVLSSLHVIAGELDR